MFARVPAEVYLVRDISEHGNRDQRIKNYYAIAPLRCLDEVLAAIASKDFDPDVMRSGAFVAPASRSSATTALPVDGAGALPPTMSNEAASVEASGAGAALTAA